jgi:hypothetical protein
VPVDESHPVGRLHLLLEVGVGHSDPFVSLRNLAADGLSRFCCFLFALVVKIDEVVIFLLHNILPNQLLVVLSAFGKSPQIFH